MKKLLSMLLILLISLVLVACGGGEDQSADDREQADETPSTQEDETQEDEGAAEDGEAELSEDADQAKVGDVVSTEAGEATLVSRTDDVGTFESGPIKLTIVKANGVSMAVNDDYVDFFETDQLEYIQVDLEVENTSDDTISFYASQAIMTTSTGEQLEADFLLSDHIDGDYFGKVSKSGSSFYILEKSKAEDVESIRLIFSAPHDENFENVGEDIDVEIPLNK